MNSRNYIIIASVIVVLVIMGVIFNSSKGNNGPEQEQIFQQANEHYQEEQYSEAIRKYQELLNQGFHSANVHNNLASSYKRLGDIGKSILHYEKATQLDYYDNDIRNNLAKVRKDSALYEKKDTNSWNKVVAILSSKHWVILASLVFLGLTMFYVLKLIGYFMPSIKFQVFTFMAVTGIIVISIFAIKTKRNNLQGKAIVLVQNTSLRISPFEGGDELAVLQPGKSITIVSNKQHDNYTQIKLDTGKYGWLKTSEIEPIQLSIK